MARVTLEVQVSASALEANLRGRASGVRRAVQQLNRRRGPSLYRRLYDATPKRTHFMANALRYEPSPNDFTYRIGWSARDFEAAGKAPYFLYVLFGTRFMAGNDFVSPIFDEERREYRRELREALRREAR